jgi:hypothetical protein
MSILNSKDKLSLRNINENLSLLNISKIECSGLKNVEMGGTLSSMFGGALGGALSGALGGENDPFVVINFGSWSMKTSTIKEGGNNVVWDKLDMTVSLPKEVISDNKITLEVYDENNIRANVLIGKGVLLIEDMDLNSSGNNFESCIQLYNESNETTGVITLTMSIQQSSFGPSSAESSNSTDNKAKQEIVKLKEIIKQREKSLETANSNMAALTKASEGDETGVDDLLRRIEDLSLELQQKDSMLRDLQLMTSSQQNSGGI